VKSLLAFRQGAVDELAVWEQVPASVVKETEVDLHPNL
jgi:hypothetical protein